MRRQRQNRDGSEEPVEKNSILSGSVLSNLRRGRAADFFADAIGAGVTDVSQQHPSRANKHSSIQAQRMTKNPLDEQLPRIEVVNMLKRQTQFLKEIIPYAPTAEHIVKEKKVIEGLAVRLVRTYMLTDSRERVLDEAAGKIGLEEAVATTESDTEAVSLIQKFQKEAELMEKNTQDGLTDEVVKKHEIYLAFQEELDILCEGSEVRFTQSGSSGTAAKSRPGGGSSKEDNIHIPTVDPLTKAQIKNPVKNKFCSHIYGNDTMLDLISQNKKSKCPYPGCANPQFIRKDHLIYDADLADKINQKIKRGETQSSEQILGGGGHSAGRQSQSILLEDEEEQ